MTDSDKDTYRIVIGLMFRVRICGLVLSRPVSGSRIMSVGCVRV